MSVYTPVEFFLSHGWKVTSPYGMRTLNGVRAMHQGTDFGGKKLGEPVRTPYGGKVTVTGNFGTAGNAVGIRTEGKGKIMCFFHLQTIKVKKGQVVKAGDIIATNGATGNATGPHVHFEIRNYDGTAFGTRPAWGDPAKYYDVEVEEEMAIPKSPGEGYLLYQVKSGDTLSKIATRFGTTWQNLQKLNSIPNANLIRTGQLIWVPVAIGDSEALKKEREAHTKTKAELDKAKKRISSILADITAVVQKHK